MQTQTPSLETILTLSAQALEHRVLAAKYEQELSLAASAYRTEIRSAGRVSKPTASSNSEVNSQILSAVQSGRYGERFTRKSFGRDFKASDVSAAIRWMLDTKAIRHVGRGNYACVTPVQATNGTGNAVAHVN